MAMCGACTSLALKAHLLPHSLGCRTPRLQEGSEQGYPERMAVGRGRPGRSPRLSAAAIRSVLLGR